MNVDFKRVVSVLYDQFGDQAISWTLQQVANYADSKSESEGQPDDAKGPEVDDASAEHSDGLHESDTDGLPENDSEGPQESDSDEYEDAEAFSASVDSAVQNLAGETIVSPDQVVDAVMTLVVMAGEVRKFEEAQITKRVGIAADRDIAIAQIKAQQELLTDYLERSFDERAQNFSKLFTVVDEALDSGNMTALALGLESVIQLASTSPFKDLRTVEETATALANPNHEWDF